ASVLHTLSTRFGSGLVPSTSSYHRLAFPAPSTPVSDPLLGCDTFPIVHDGAALGRLDKLRAIAGWETAISLLRVCIHDAARGGNCGRCHKCLLTAAELRVLELPPACFDPVPTDDDLARWAPSLPGTSFYVEEARALLAEAVTREIDRAWT